MIPIYTVFNPAPFEPIKGVKRQYTDDYLRRMYRMVESSGFKLKVIQSDLPGWWGKIELFQYKPMFYMDLSVALLPGWEHIAKSDYSRFTACRDFIHPKLLNSKIMAWNEDADVSHVYDKFMEHPEQFMSQYTAGMDMWGDQSFIDHNVGDRQYFQDLFPNEIVSYRMGNITDETKIICFHGRPKPHDTEYY